MDPKANTPEVQKEKTTDPQDNEIAGNFIGDLIGQPAPAAEQAHQSQDGTERPTPQPLSETEEKAARNRNSEADELLPDA